MITKDEIQKLKERIDCRELIQSLGIEFKGTNISCLNSSHPDKNPSMAVYPDHVLCFGCNYNLDAVGIVQNIQGLSFKDAISYLASKYHFSFPESNPYIKTKNKYQKKDPVNKYSKVNFLTEKKPHKSTDTSIKDLLWKIIEPVDPTEESIHWLKSRKISVECAWKLGCRDITPVLNAVENLIDSHSSDLLKENNFINDRGNVWAPLLNKVKGDKNYSGIIVPIFDVNSKIHSYRWRFFNPIKTENSVLKVLGQPACELMPIGLNYADKIENKDAIYICEGEPDWLSLNTLFHERNFKDKAAIGLCVLSNTWKTEWTDLLAKFKKIYVCLHDTDKAIKVTEKIALSLLEKDSKGLNYWQNNFFRKLFSEKKDANDFLKEGNLHNFLPI